MQQKQIKSALSTFYIDKDDIDNKCNNMEWAGRLKPHCFIWESSEQEWDRMKVWRCQRRVAGMDIALRTSCRLWTALILHSESLRFDKTEKRGERKKNVSESGWKEWKNDHQKVVVTGVNKVKEQTQREEEGARERERGLGMGGENWSWLESSGEATALWCLTKTPICRTAYKKAIF